MQWYFGLASIVCIWLPMRLNRFPRVCVLCMSLHERASCSFSLYWNLGALHKNLNVLFIGYRFRHIIWLLFKVLTYIYFKHLLSLFLFFFHSIILDKSHKILFQLHSGTDVASSLWNNYHVYLWELEIELPLCSRVTRKDELQRWGLKFLSHLKQWQA